MASGPGTVQLPVLRVGPSQCKMRTVLNRTLITAFTFDQGGLSDYKVTMSMFYERSMSQLVRPWLSLLRS